MNLNRILKKLLIIYLFLFSIRSLIHLILQCIYLTLCKHLQAQNGDEQDSNTSLKLIVNSTAKFMATYGQIHRDTATTGVFYYCLLFFSCLIFYLIRFISKGKYLNYFKEIGFIAFIKNPELESINIASKIEAFLNALIFSNLNYGRKSFARNFKSVSNFNHSYGNSEESDRQSSNKSLNRLNSTDTHLLRSCSLIKSLRGQLSYLMKLSTSNKAKIWPPNRNRLWARELTRFSLSLYMIVGSINWCVAEIGCFLIINYIFNTVNQNNPSKETSNKFTFFDRLWSADYIIYAYFGGDFFTTPLIVSITSIQDQFKFLDTFEPKLRKICDKTKQLELINSNVQSHPHSLKYSNRIGNKLKTECDQEAIEMYISYQLFIADIEPSIKLAQNAVGQLVSLALCCLLPTLLFYHDIPADQLLAFACLCLSFLLSVNGTFCACAALYVSCSRVSKLIWSFIALAEAYNHHQYTISSADETIDTQTNKGQGFKLGLFCAKDSSEEPSESSHLTYFSHSLVTPHTMYLWRRLAESEGFIVENFVCRLYGIFDITYKGILKLNYLLITCILYTLTYHR